ncbi:protein-tyrosine phosphatase family protein [Allokutzneria oryzae]|uniref:Protein tyrosine phosphatase n=1 Tax=Allokutzneria oryzae TaxID=1378989 RepID=A0ABV5ZTX3_9PSEU
MTALSPPGLLRLPDGLVVRGRGLGQPRPTGPAPAFGLYLGSTRLRRRYDGDLGWQRDWVRWPDFLLPRDWSTALHQRARDGESVEVACYGGTGRTGTVLACLATSGGLSPADAVSFVRAIYRERALETAWPVAWVSWFAKRQRGFG